MWLFGFVKNYKNFCFSPILKCVLCIMCLMCIHECCYIYGREYTSLIILGCVVTVVIGYLGKNVLSQCCLNQSLFKLIQDSVSSLSTDNKLKELTSIILKRLGL